MRAPDVSADLLRNLTLLGPLVALVAVAGLRRRGVLARWPGDVPLACLAGLLVWLGVLAVEVATDLWRFADGPTTFLGMPLETSVGWALTWGALPALAGGRRVLWFGAFAWTDVLVVPRLEPLLVLGPRWWVGEVLLLAAVAAPALLLGHATEHRRWLAGRVVVQALTAGALVLWLLPTVAFSHGPGGWSSVADHPLPVRAALLAAAVVVGVPTLSAVVELARAGRGTPYPWDPPERLVTTGPYAYVANPMQLGAVALLVLLAVAAGSPWLLLTSAMTGVLLHVVAGPHERATMSRWEGFEDYRRQVPSWRPRHRPYVPAPTYVWVSRDCGLCRATGSGIEALHPVRLVVVDAEDAGVRLTRMRWAGAGLHERGVAAFARSLEQVHLGLAWLGWAVRLPGVTWAVQTVADACGLGPREVRPPGARHRAVRDAGATGAAAGPSPRAPGAQPGGSGRSGR
ncbi:methyltransferase family protein [Thalassiella azotivora]